MWVEQGFPARAAHLQKVFGEQGHLLQPPFQHVAETVEVDLPQLLALHGKRGSGQWGAQLVGHHPQQPLLGLQPVDQCFVLLTQHQQLIFELEFLLGAAAIEFGGLEAEAKTAHHFVLLPARHPSAQLLKDAAAGEHLLGQWLQFDQRRRHHKPMQFKQFRLLDRICHLECHVKAAVLMFQKLDQ